MNQFVGGQLGSNQWLLSNVYWKNGIMLDRKDILKWAKFTMDKCIHPFSIQPLGLHHSLWIPAPPVTKCLIPLFHQAVWGLVWSRCLMLNPFSMFGQQENRLSAKKSDSRAASTLCWSRTKNRSRQGPGTRIIVTNQDQLNLCDRHCGPALQHGYKIETIVVCTVGSWSQE